MSTGFDGPTVDIAVGPIRALRSFRLADDGSLLPITEAGGGRRWVDGENVARCTTYSHPAPHSNCHCGFYAYGNPQWVDHGAYAEFQSIQAVVECYGTVIAGEKGLRCQKAKIVALATSGVPRVLEEAVARTYPSAQRFATSREMLAQVPLTAVDTYEEPSSPTRLAVLRNAAWALPLLYPLVAILLTLFAPSAAPFFCAAVIMVLTTVLARFAARARIDPWTARIIVSCFIGGTLVTTIYLADMSKVANASILERLAVLPGALGILALILGGAVLLRALRIRRLPWKPSVAVVPREADLRLLTMADLDFSAVPEDPRERDHKVKGGLWVTTLPVADGHLAFLQTVVDEPVPCAAALRSVRYILTDPDCVGVIFSNRDEFVQVAARSALKRHQVLSAPVLLSDAVERLGLPARLWCPLPMRSQALSYLLAPARSSMLPDTLVANPGAVGLLLESPAAQEVVRRSRFVLAREEYRQAQSVVAAAGVEPLVSPSLPEPVARPDAATERRGWVELMEVKGSSAAIVANLYLRTTDDRSAVAMIQTAHQTFGSPHEAASWIDGQGFNPSPTMAGHLALGNGDQMLVTERSDYWREYDSVFASVAPCEVSRGRWCAVSGAVLSES